MNGVALAKARRGSAAQNATALTGLMVPGKFSLAQRVATVPRLLAATLRGEDTGLARWRLALLGLGVMYVLSPLDFIPEALLGPLGLGDDGLVSVAVATFLLSASEAYLQRGKTQPADNRSRTGLTPARVRIEPQRARFTPMVKRPKDAPGSNSARSSPPLDSAESGASEGERPISSAEAGGAELLDNRIASARSCPKCGGNNREPIAPGYWRCTSIVATFTGGPGLTNPMKGPMAIEHRDVCGNEYTEGLNGGTTCACGTFAIGHCAECSTPVCGTHSGLWEGRERLCGTCWKPRQAAQTALHEFQRALDDLHLLNHNIPFFREGPAARMLSEAGVQAKKLVWHYTEEREVRQLHPLPKYRYRTVTEERHIPTGARVWVIGKVHWHHRDPSSHPSKGPLVTALIVPEDVEDLKRLRGGMRGHYNWLATWSNLIAVTPGRNESEVFPLLEGSAYDRGWEPEIEPLVMSVRTMCGKPTWTGGDCPCEEELRLGGNLPRRVDMTEKRQVRLTAPTVDAAGLRALGVEVAGRLSAVGWPGSALRSVEVPGPLGLGHRQASRVVRELGETHTTTFQDSTSWQSSWLGHDGTLYHSVRVISGPSYLAPWDLEAVEPKVIAGLEDALRRTLRTIADEN